MTSLCEVWFYQLERSDVAAVLPGLLEKAGERGWRALVRSSDPARLDALDAALWTYRDEAFLGHGLDTEPHAAAQPVLLTSALSNANGAQMLVLVDGAEPGSLEGFSRCLVLFEASDPPALDKARAFWRQAKGEGRAAAFWRESETGWRKQA